MLTIPWGHGANSGSCACGWPSTVVLCRGAIRQPANQDQLESAVAELQDQGLLHVQGDIKANTAVVRRIAIDD